MKIATPNIVGKQPLVHKSPQLGFGVMVPTPKQIKKEPTKPHSAASSNPKKRPDLKPIVKKEEPVLKK
jgi:hypothetical protein